jgi:hypothetical protein
MINDSDVLSHESDDNQVLFECRPRSIFKRQLSGNCLLLWLAPRLVNNYAGTQIRLVSHC